MNIREYCEKLRLPYMRENWQQLVDEARQGRQDYNEFLANLLDSEWRLRLENGQLRRPANKSQAQKSKKSKYVNDVKKSITNQGAGCEYLEPPPKVSVRYAHSVFSRRFERAAYSLTGVSSTDFGSAKHSLTRAK